MKTMGLDLSLVSTGISINGATTSIRVKSKGEERLAAIKNSILNLIRTHEIDVVALEGYSYGSAHSQAHKIGELGGVTRLALYEAGVTIIIIPPKCRAKFASGRGNAGKDEVMAAVTDMTGIEWIGSDGNDRCDAFVLEEMLLEHMGESRYPRSTAQLSALDGVDWSSLDSNRRIT